MLVMFMNDCMLTVFCLSEENEKFKGFFLVNHQTRKTQTIIETVQSQTSGSQQRCRRVLWDFILAELEMESWSTLSLLETPVGVC